MPRLFLVAMFWAMCTVHAWSATYSSAVLSQNPLGYFQMNEAAGTVAIDSAGAPQNGVYTNNPSLNVVGPQSPAFAGFPPTNTAVQFDGVNDHVFNNSLPFTNLTTPYTASGWVNNTRLNNAQAITGYVLSRGSGAINAYDSLGIMGSFQGTPGSLFLFNGLGVLQGATAMTTGEWHHVAYTRSGTGVAVYLDGAFQTSSAAYANTMTGNDFYIGQRADGFGQTQGRIDEVAVYNNVVLTGKQINAQYNAAFSTGLYSINNANFEIQNVDLPITTNLNQNGQGDGAYSNDVIQGWTGNGVQFFGVFDTTNAEYAGTTNDVNPVSGGNGDQVGYITTTGTIASVSQTLPDPLQAGKYTFTLAVGSRLNRASAGYLIEMLAGETVVASEADAIALPIGSLIDRSLSFSLAADSPLLGQLLTLRISNTLTTGGQRSTDFDNARLLFAAAAVPEPSSLVSMLFVGAIVALGARRWSRRGKAAE